MKQQMMNIFFNKLTCKQKDMKLICCCNLLNHLTPDIIFLKTNFYQINSENTAMMKQLSLALNFQRWINHFQV